MKKLTGATDPLWYKDAIIYEIHVRAFDDSNCDGIRAVNKVGIHSLSVLVRNRCTRLRPFIG